jgi:hypothetical protein
MNVWEIVRDVLLVLHFVGLAALLGGWFVQLSETPKRMTPGMWHGVLTQVVTGVLLVGVRYPLHDAVDFFALPSSAKVAVKVGVALVVAVLVFLGKKKESVTTGYWGAVGGLTLLNVVVAVFWR